MAKAWEDTPAGQAALFGWSQSVINSNPELKKLFAQATKGNWTTDHFIAKVRDTKWFKTHSDTYRQALILQKSDPATYKQNVSGMSNQIMALATQMGVHGLTAKQLATMAEQAVWFGWDSTTLRQHLVGMVKTTKSGDWTGDAAQAAEHFKQLAGQYGVSISAGTLNSWVKQAAVGGFNDDAARAYLTKQAISRYPSLADRLNAGETTMDIASPYMQSYSDVLEVNPNSISLKDPMIQAALAAKDAKGKATTKTVWQFEQELRNDPRYMKTQQAQDKTMAVGHQVLRDMGFMGN